MFWLYHLVSLSLLVLGKGDHVPDNEERGLRNESTEPRFEQIRSPTLEVFMHLPAHFRQLRSFRNSLGIKPERIRSKGDERWKRDTRREGIVDVRSYEIARPLFNPKNTSRAKREAESPVVGTTPVVERPEAEKLVSSLARSEIRETPHTVLPVPDALRGQIYSSYPVKEFDIVDIDDPDDPRRRRNDSADGPDDNSQRDKRTFMDEENGDTTTPLPFWKRKKENPPFITGRGTSVQKGNAYTPAQHRSGESARESHSLKNLDKPVQSNEISRTNQDNYYASTNRRTYSRQSDGPPSSTPKSVYDTIDYSGKRNQDVGRNHEQKKETLRDGRVPPTHEQYSQHHYQYNPWPYDRPHYQPPYPYPTDFLGRGVEYYHRTYDPSSGRIIYYANMPENGRSFDYRFTDPMNRNFYVNNRPYVYDPYYRNYVPPYDSYRFVNGFGRSTDYARSGRSNSQAFAYPYQEREKFPRDARFNGAFERGNRLKDELRNKTYIIYDAEENRSQFSRPQYSPDANRMAFTPAPINPGVPQVPQMGQMPFRQPPFTPPVDYFPPVTFPVRNQFYPSASGPHWGLNQRPGPGVTDSNLNSRPLNSPEVQLPLTTSNRDLDKNKKS